MQRVEHHFQAMGGPCSLRLDCADENLVERALSEAESRIEALEARYSRYRNDSLVSEINRAAGADPVPIDPETAGLLRYADTLFEESGGAFDLTAGVLRRAWKFREGRLPASAEVEALLPLVGWQQVAWDEHSVRLPVSGMELDFGGLVKEYACDAIAALLRDLGIEHALVSLAGDMVAVGPQADGTAWRVGIQHPRAPAAMAYVPLERGALASSGDYERCIEVGGVRYGHILNPRTGWPAQGLLAASVLAEQCLVAGSGATVALLKGRPAGLDWLTELGLPWLAIDAELDVHGTLQAVDAVQQA